MINITVLSPVRNRPGFSSRLIDYLEEVYARFPILLGDASQNAKVAHSYKELAAKSRLDISYVRLSEDGGSNFIANLGRLAQLISTDYYLWLREDDFPFIPAASRAADELARTGASIWIGTVVDFRVRGSSSRVSGNIVSARWALECSGRYGARKGTWADSPAERLQVMERVKPIEAIADIEVLRKATSPCLRANGQRWWGLSQALSASVLIRGHVLSSSEIVLFRQENTPDSAGSDLASVVKPTETEVLNLSRALLSDLSFPSLDSPLRASYQRHFRMVRRTSLQGWLALYFGRFIRRLRKRLTQKSVRSTVLSVKSVKQYSSDFWDGALVSARAITPARPSSRAPYLRRLLS